MPVRFAAIAGFIDKVRQSRGAQITVGDGEFDAALFLIRQNRFNLAEFIFGEGTQRVADKCAVHVGKINDSGSFICACHLLH